MCGRIVGATRVRPGVLAEHKTLVLHQRTKVHEFSYNATIAKKTNLSNTREVKIQHNASNTTYRRTLKKEYSSTDKAAEALHYLVKLSLLGQKMMEIGESQAPQSEFSPESKLSYPANTINTWKCLGSTILARLPFLPEKIASSKRDLT